MPKNYNHSGITFSQNELESAYRRALSEQADKNRLGQDGYEAQRFDDQTWLETEHVSTLIRHSLKKSDEASATAVFPVYSKTLIKTVLSDFICDKIKKHPSFTHLLPSTEPLPERSTLKDPRAIRQRDQAERARNQKERQLKKTADEILENTIFKDISPFSFHLKACWNPKSSLSKKLLRVDDQFKHKQLKHFVIPFNKNNNHYTVAVGSVENDASAKEVQIQYVDSYGHKISSDDEDSLKDFSLTALKTNLLGIQSSSEVMQKDGTNCGIFAWKNAVSLIKGRASKLLTQVKKGAYEEALDQYRYKAVEILNENGFHLYIPHAGLEGDVSVGEKESSETLCEQAVKIFLPYFVLNLSTNLAYKIWGNDLELEAYYKHRKEFTTSQSFQSFKESFASYYEFEFSKVGENLRQLFKTVTHPADLEVLLKPALKNIFKKVIKHNELESYDLQLTIEDILIDLHHECDGCLSTKDIINSHKLVKRPDIKAFIKSNDRLFDGVIKQFGNKSQSINWAELNRAFKSFCLNEKMLTREQIKTLIKHFNISTSQQFLCRFVFTDDNKWTLPEELKRLWYDDIQEQPRFSEYQALSQALSNMHGVTHFHKESLRKRFVKTVHKVMVHGLRAADKKYYLMQQSKWTQLEPLMPLAMHISRKIMQQNEAFLKTEGFAHFQELFAMVYELDNQRVLDKLREAFKSYPHYNDQALILIPVLQRMLIGQYLKKTHYFESDDTYDPLASLYNAFELSFETYWARSKSEEVSYLALQSEYNVSNARKCVRFANLDGILCKLTQDRHKAYLDRLVGQYVGQYTFNKIEDDSIELHEHLKTLQEGLAQYFKTGERFSYSKGLFSIADPKSCVEQIAHAVQVKDLAQVNHILHHRYQVAKVRVNGQPLLPYLMSIEQDKHFARGLFGLIIYHNYRARAETRTFRPTHETFNLFKDIDEEHSLFEYAIDAGHLSRIRYVMAELNAAQALFADESKLQRAMNRDLNMCIDSLARCTSKTLKTDDGLTLVKLLKADIRCLQAVGAYNPVHTAVREEKIGFLTQSLGKTLYWLRTGQSYDKHAIKDIYDASLDQAKQVMRDVMPHAYDDCGRTAEFRLKQLNKILDILNKFDHGSDVTTLRTYVKTLGNLLLLNGYALSLLYYSTQDYFARRSIRHAKAQSSSTYHISRGLFQVVRCLANAHQVGMLRTGIELGYTTAYTAFNLSAREAYLNMVEEMGASVAETIPWLISPETAGYCAKSIAMLNPFALKGVLANGLGSLTSWTLDKASLGYLPQNDLYDVVQSMAYWGLTASEFYAFYALGYIPAMAFGHVASAAFSLTGYEQVEALSLALAHEGAHEWSQKPKGEVDDERYEARFEKMIEKSHYYPITYSSHVIEHQFNKWVHYASQNIKAYIGVETLSETLQAVPSMSQILKNYTIEEKIAYGNELLKPLLSPIYRYNAVRANWLEQVKYYIEGSILEHMPESAFKAERQYVIHQFDLANVYQQHQKLEQDLERSVESGDQQAIEKAQQAFDAYDKILEQEQDKAQVLFEETDGYQYYDKWQNAVWEKVYAHGHPSSTQAEIDQKTAEEAKAYRLCKLHNPEVVVESMDALMTTYQKIMDTHKDNLFDVHSLAKVIENVINVGFDNFPVHKLGGFYADEIIRLKYPFYPDDDQDPAVVEAERQEYRSDISRHELQGLDRGKKGARRVQKRLYDYILAKLTDTEKKQRPKRWERILKRAINEISVTLIGWKPFKKFKGPRSSGGRPNIQFQYNMDGQTRITLNTQTPDWTIELVKLYDSEERKLSKMRLEPRQRVDSQSTHIDYHAPAVEPAKITLDHDLETIQHDSQDFYMDDFWSLEKNQLLSNVVLEEMEKISKLPDFYDLDDERKQPSSQHNPEQSKPEVITHQKGFSGFWHWLKLGFRSVCGEKSAEVDAWKEANTKASPKVAAFMTGFKDYTIAPQRVVTTGAVRGVAYSMKALIDASYYLDEEIKRVAKGEMMQTEVSVRLMCTFIKEDIARAIAREDTETVKQFYSFIQNMENMSPEEFYTEAFALFIPLSRIAKCTGTVGKISEASRAMGVTYKAAERLEMSRQSVMSRFNFRISTIEQSRKMYHPLFEKAQLHPSRSAAPSGVLMAGEGRVSTLAGATEKAAHVSKSVDKASTVDLTGVSKQGLSGSKSTHVVQPRVSTAGGAGKNLLFTKAGKLDFAPTGFKDAQLFPIEKLATLGEYLRRRGVDLYPVEYLPKGSQFPGFTSKYGQTGRPAIFLPRDATVLEVKHELSHYLDFKTLGKSSYDKLTTYQKEKMVLDRLKENRVWETLTKNEKRFSKRYVQKIKLDTENKMMLGGPNVK